MALGRAWRGAEMAVAQALSPTIFILEDDPDIAGLLKHHLQPAAYGVSWVPTSSGFLDEMHARRPALELLHMMVPGDSGLDVDRYIRNKSTQTGGSTCYA